MMKNTLRLILVTPVILFIGCSARPSGQTPVQEQSSNNSSMGTVTKPKTFSPPVHTVQAKLMPSEPPSKLERQVGRYNSLLTQAQGFERQSDNYEHEGMDAGSKWAETHGDVSDSHPYPQNIQFLLDTGMKFNRKQSQALRDAASIHQHLVRSSVFKQYYVEAELVFNHDQIPGDLFKTDAEYLHFIKRR